MKRQSGTALITVLLIVSVITGLAVSLASDFQITVAKAEQRFVGAQIKQYFLGVESFAVFGLKRDAEENEKNDKVVFDHLGEEWSTTTLSPPVDGGWLDFKLNDAQGRFNLNQLGGRPSPYKPLGNFTEQFTPQQRRFVRLLQTNPELNIDPNDAKAITEAVIDWIDADDTPTGSGGAESGFYSGLDPAYRPANQPFTDVSELQLVKGVTPELFRYLQPLVVALPDDSGININTADIAIMRTLNEKTAEEPLSLEDGETLVANRPGKVTDNSDQLPSEAVTIAPSEGEFYKNVAEFTQSDPILTIFGTDGLEDLVTDGLTTKSDYFLLLAQAQVVNQYRQRTSLLKRTKDKEGFRVWVISRSQSLL